MNDTFPYIDEKNKKGGKKFYKESFVPIFSLIYRLKNQNLYL